MNTLTFEKKKLDNTIGIVLDENEEEKEFDYYLKLWVDGKISYKSMIENYPDHKSSMLRKILKKIINIV